ncbi:MAG TPA: hypothetical protein VGM18_03340 [Candidatus Sulfotelmatobacter sp.]|jgi:hypothetical protein
MKPTKHVFFTALALTALTAGAWAQTETASNAAPANPAAPAASAPAQPTITAADIQSLKDALAAQQLQIEKLTEQLQHQQELQAQQSAINAAAADTNRPQATQQVAALGNPAVQQDSPAMQSPTQPLEETYNKQMEGPLTLHFRGINITPGGYAEGAFVRRSRALAADLPTPFNSVTMPGASQSQLPEFFGSARQSKITTFVDGRLKGVDLSSYVSADFLSAGVTSTSTSTNSYTLRMRQAWGQAKFNNGFSFLAGQAWSLATENGHGISPDDDLGRTNDARPKVIDPSYNAGFVFTRQYGLRATQNFGDKVAIAVAIENAQATVTSHGNAGNYLLGSNGASNSYNTTATYSFNPSPDILAKIAFDPGFGHYEVFGILDRFQDRVFPCGEVLATATCGGQAVGVTSAVGAYNASKTGGGAGASARFDIAKRVTFGVKALTGSGIGRYAPGGLPDAAINGNGTIHLIRNTMGLGTLEFHLTKKLDLNTYAGLEYASRSVSFDPLGSSGAGALVGYGVPTSKNTGCGTETAPATSTNNGTVGFDPGGLSNCTADTRVLIEGTGALWYKFYSGPRGSFRFGAQYSYITRNSWSGVGGDPHGIDNMIYTSFRYVLP